MPHAHPRGHSKCPPRSSPVQKVSPPHNCLHSEPTGAPGFGPAASGRWVRGTGIKDEELPRHEKRVDEGHCRYFESLDAGFGAIDDTSGACSPGASQEDSRSKRPVAGTGPTSKLDRSRFSPRSVKSQVKLEAYLLDHGFPCAHRPKWTMTCSGAKKTYPIHVAAKTGDEVFVKLLLKEGVDIEKKDSRNRTAYDIAHKHNCNHSHASVLRIFAGMSDLLHRDSDGDVDF